MAHMETETHSQWTGPAPNLHRFALFTALATLVLLGAGGLVTSRCHIR